MSQTADLLEQFFQQTEKEALNDRQAVPPLIQALLEDPNPHRRHAAARALGWIKRPGREAALALARCLANPRQPHAAREEAAESLAYVGTRQTIPALISALRNPDVRIRFWAVFGLGRSCRRDPRAIRALEAILGDEEVAPGNWWSVGKEALAVLAIMRPPVRGYREKLEAEAQRIRAEPNSSAEDRRWTDHYSCVKEEIRAILGTGAQ